MYGQERRFCTSFKNFRRGLIFVGYRAISSGKHEVCGRNSLTDREFLSNSDVEIYFHCFLIQKMSDMRQWTRDFLLEFIELYRSLPCVWKIKSAEYRDRVKKNKAYEVLLLKYKEVDDNATIKTVKQKIDSLRGAFRKEMKKLKESSRSGAGSEDIYKPHLWYFDNLSFLTDEETARRGVGNLEDKGEDEDADEINTEHEEYSQVCIFTVIHYILTETYKAFSFI